MVQSTPATLVALVVTFRRETVAVVKSYTWDLQNHKQIELDAALKPGN